MKRAANPGEGEIPIGASEIPGPMAYTDPETGERVIEVESEAAAVEEPVKAPKVSAKRSRAAKG